MMREEDLAATKELDIAQIKFLPPQIVELSSIVMPSPLGDVIKLPPDGASGCEVGVQALNSQGEPMPKVRVEFVVDIIRPTSPWRNVDELAPRFGSNATKFREKVTAGQIRLRGTVLNNFVFTNDQGIAKTVYFTSHIGGNDAQPARERVIARIAVWTSETIFEIGLTNLVPIPEIAGGLRIDNSCEGRYIDPGLIDLLNYLGGNIRDAKWPQPATITAGTMRWGGLYPPHFTHIFGGSMDFRPMSTDGQPCWCRQDGTSSSNYDRKHTKVLIKVFKAAGAARIWFNDPDLVQNGATPQTGHDDHIHVTWEKQLAVKSVSPTVFA